MNPDQDKHRKCGSTMSRDEEIAFWIAIGVCLFTVLI